MYKIICMKADYEPWWQFEDMEDKFTEIMSYDSFEQYELKVHELLQSYRTQYKNEGSREDRYFAFWNEGEWEYCEGCDEDLQTYYGMIFSHPIGTFIK